VGLRSILLVVFSLVLLLGSGCGYKGDLVVPGADNQKSEKKAG
jgi:hypothetical protein